MRPASWQNIVDQVGVAELIEHEWTHAVITERLHRRVDAGDVPERELNGEPHDDEFWIERGRIYRLMVASE